MKLSVLSSGSGGNSTIINSSDGSILIDAGITGKKLFERLESVAADAKNIMGIIITHDHHDHIDGAGVIARKLKIPVYIHRANYESSAEKLDKCEIIFIENEFKVGSFTIIPFPISHDGTANYAYNIISEGKKISHVTDIGIVTETVKFRIRDSDLLVMESWLCRAGFKNIRCVDVARTSPLEQRKTRWIQTESLKDFLDPHDPDKTVEGYPAPVRAIFLAEAGSS